MSRRRKIGTPVGSRDRAWAMVQERAIRELRGVAIDPALQTVTDGQAELVDAVVCADLTHPMLFADNTTGECADCGRPLQWRPYAPKIPPKICMRCARTRTLQRQARRSDA